MGTRPRALVVGAGYAGQRHRDALGELGVECDGPRSAREVARDPSVLRASAADVVHVCATNDLHAPLAAAALEAGKHVVCEKPLALDVAAADALVERAARSGRVAVVGYGYRFHPLVVELAARVRAGELGALHVARGAFLQDWLLLPTDENWRVDAARGGPSRVVADIGAHWLDLAETVAGQRAAAVAAQVGSLHGRTTEDFANLLVRFTAGLAGACVVSQAAAGHRNDLELAVDGNAGSATWRYESPNTLVIGSRDETSARRITRDGPFVSPLARALAALPAGPNEGRRNLLAAVYARIERGETPEVALPTFEDGARHLRFARAALESASGRAWVDVA